MTREKFISRFSTNLRNAILKKFKTQKEFAEFFEESPQTVNKWCNGETLPDLFKLYKMCQILDTSLNSLIEYDVELGLHNNLDYAIFDTIVSLANKFALEKNITLSGKQYLAIYENIIGLQKFNHTLSIEELFKLLLPTLSMW